jgi:type I restriction enzyme S subunit
MDALTPTLLAKAFRGELVPQDPADEPAAILLERIRAAREATSAQTQTESQRRPQRRERNEEPMPDRTTISPTHLTDLLKARGPLTPRKAMGGHRGFLSKTSTIS